MSGQTTLSEGIDTLSIRLYHKLEAGHIYTMQGQKSHDITVDINRDFFNKNKKSNFLFKSNCRFKLYLS